MAIFTFLLWAIAAYWTYAALNAGLNLLLVPRLAPEGAGDPLPSLSVVIPARDEAAGIRAAVESHCTQDYPGLQVVVVDDGSTDGTDRILEELARHHANLTVVRGGEPPEGWLGKPHAQMTGLGAATGEFVLFADADVRYAQGVHRRAAGEMERHRLDMLLLLARLEGRGWEPLILSMLDAFAFHASPTWLVNLPRPRFLAFGAGSGNLVRREAFEAAGGMERIAGEVVDDVAMGRMMKAYRGRFRVVLAFGDVTVRMYRGLRGCIEGFTKNLYAFFGFSPLRALFLEAADLAVHLVPALTLLAAAAAPPLRSLVLPAAFSFGVALALNLGACLWSGHPLWAGLAFPIRQALWAYILWRSARRYKKKGVVWRGRRYRPGS